MINSVTWFLRFIEPKNLGWSSLVKTVITKKIHGHHGDFLDEHIVHQWIPDLIQALNANACADNEGNKSTPKAA